MNERDSEIMEQLMWQEGYLRTPAPEQADLILINTCSIRAKAEQKVYSLLGQLRSLKKERPTLLIGVAGCVAQQEGEKILARMPHVDLLLGTQQIHCLPALVQELAASPGAQRIATSFSDAPVIPLIRPATCPDKDHPAAFRKFVTIMQGCNNFCSYCVVPFTRGREISRPVNKILEEVNLLVEQGVTEITLLGQNVNSYGLTNSVAAGPFAFPDLLHQVAAIKGLKRLRFTTSNPKDLSTALMRCFAEIDILCPQFHLPVQSGSDRILKRMNRKYSAARYLDLVERLRSYRPDIALTTDIIIGFPGETEHDFMQTMNLLNQVRFHGSFSFCYSDRPNTRSALFSDKVEEDVKRERLQRFQHAQDAISLARNQEYCDTTMEILIEEVTPGVLRGRTATNHVVHCQYSRPSSAAERHPSYQAGNYTDVRIIGAGKHSLRGRLDSSEVVRPVSASSKASNRQGHSP